MLSSAYLSAALLDNGFFCVKLTLIYRTFRFYQKNDGGAIIISSRRLLPQVKGVIAEVSKAQCCVDGAGLRENMSQTVTKVESYHWVEVVSSTLHTLLYQSMYNHEFFV